MFTKSDVKNAVAKAIALEENRYPNGEINFNFVDADAFAECGVDHNSKEECDAFYEWFEEVADECAADYFEGV
jgi:hypothetical protein